MNVSLNLDTRITMSTGVNIPVESYDFYKAKETEQMSYPNDIMLGCTSLPTTTINLHLTSTHLLYF
jgi:hypothetical protein